MKNEDHKIAQPESDYVNELRRRFERENDWIEVLKAKIEYEEACRRADIMMAIARVYEMG